MTIAKTYTFVTDCVSIHNRDVEALEDMIDTAQKITLDTFAQHVDVRQIEQRFGYAQIKAAGLLLKDDYAVSFYRSRFKGVRVYFMVHSAIEYIYAASPIHGYHNA